MKRAIVLHESDNVATLIDNANAGEQIQLFGKMDHLLLVGEDIPYGHKVAITSLQQGEEILKYGQVIGRATAGIEQGRHAHVHNIESLRGRGDLVGRGNQSEGDEEL